MPKSYTYTLNEKTLEKLCDIGTQGTKTITENGTNIDVKKYAAVDVNVPSGPSLDTYKVYATDDEGTATEIYDGMLQPTVYKYENGSLSNASDLLPSTGGYWWYETVHECEPGDCYQVSGLDSREYNVFIKNSDTDFSGYTLTEGRIYSFSSGFNDLGIGIYDETLCIVSGCSGGRFDPVTLPVSVGDSVELNIQGAIYKLTKMEN